MASSGSAAEAAPGPAAEADDDEAFLTYHVILRT